VKLGALAGLQSLKLLGRRRSQVTDTADDDMVGAPKTDFNDALPDT
jgi:hypothetical protein